MKLIKLATIVAAIALFAAACGDSAGTNQTANTGAQASPSASPKPTAAATPTPDEMAAAKTTYTQVCSACHGDTGDGGTVKIEGKPLKVPSLKTGHGLTHSDAEFVKQITKGGDGMPAFGDKLTPEQINGLVRFIRRDIQGGLAPTGQTDKGK